MSALTQSDLSEFANENDEEADGKILCPAGCGERIHKNRQPAHFAECDALEQGVNW